MCAWEPIFSSLLRRIELRILHIAGDSWIEHGLAFGLGIIDVNRIYEKTSSSLETGNWNLYKMGGLDRANEYQSN